MISRGLRHSSTRQMREAISKQVKTFSGMLHLYSFILVNSPNFFKEYFGFEGQKPLHTRKWKWEKNYLLEKQSRVQHLRPFFFFN